MSQRRALDVSTLPTFAFGHRSPMWWGVLGLFAIEGTMFALLLATYIYLRWRVPEWPPALEPPHLVWGTITTGLLIVSVLPNVIAKRAAERLDLAAVRRWITISSLAALVICGTRAVEFAYLNVWWDTNAYGSVVWMLIAMHTTHLVTDTYDSFVLTALMFTGPIEGKRYVDVSENALYWFFVVISWLPVYVLVYLSPRFL